MTLKHQTEGLLSLLFDLLITSYRLYHLYLYLVGLVGLGVFVDLDVVDLVGQDVVVDLDVIYHFFGLGCKSLYNLLLHIKKVSGESSLWY
jgi:hypothetical protein